LLELQRRSPASGPALRELLRPLLALLPPGEDPAR